MPDVIVSIVVDASPASIPMMADVIIRLIKGCNLSFAVRMRIRSKEKRKMIIGSINRKSVLEQYILYCSKMFLSYSST
jgi:hypothetical protein